MKALSVLLSLAALSHACTVSELYLSDAEDTARGQVVSFARSKVEFQVKSTTRLSGKFGFYLRNETQEDVAAVTIQHTELFTFFSFYGRTGEGLVNRYSDYINGTFFEEGNWKVIEIEYHKGNLKLKFTGKNPEQDNVDFLERDTGYEHIFYGRRPFTIKARVMGDFDMPLVIYPKVLEGQSYHMKHGCLDDRELNEPSKYFENKRVHYQGFSPVYMIPGEDFRVGTLILEQQGDAGRFSLPGNSQRWTITRDDVAIGRYNELFFHFNETDTIVSLQEGRRCFKNGVVSVKKVDSISFFANAPVKWIFEPEREIPYDQRIPRCEDLENTQCLAFIIGDHHPSLWSTSYPLGETMEFQVKPLGSEVPSFSLWIQELQQIVAGVRVRQTLEGIEVDFYQVVNGTSYHLRSPETLPGFELENEEWTYMYLQYEEDQLEVGMKNLEGEDWQIASGSVAIDRQLPLTAFVWSRKDLHVAHHCTEEDLQESDAQPTEETKIISSPFAVNEVFYSQKNFYFLPGPDFKVASIFIRFQTGAFEVMDVLAPDVVLGKWNMISMRNVAQMFHLPRIELPKKDGCRIRRIVAQTSEIESILVYTNTPTEWMFKKVPPSVDIAPVTDSSCALNAESGCPMKTLGQPSFRPLKYKDDMIISLSDTYGSHSDLKMVLYKAGESAEIEIFRNRSGKYVMYSEVLGINTILPDFHGFVRPSWQKPVRLSFRIQRTRFVDVSVEREIKNKYEWYTVRSENTLLGSPESYWLFLYPQSQFMALVVEDEKLERPLYQPMRNQTQEFILDDNELFISFKSRIGSDGRNALTLFLHNQNLGYVGNIEFFYGNYPMQAFLVFLYDQHYFSTVLIPTDWNEMRLKQYPGGLLSVGVRSASSGGEWETKFIRIYFERNAPVAPLFVHFKSTHSHDILVNCHRDDGSPVIENTKHEKVDDNYLRPPTRRQFWVYESATVDAPGRGQTCPMLIVAAQKLYSGVIYFHHLNGNVSTEDLHFNMTAGEFHVIYFGNAEDEQSYSKISVPLSEDELLDKELTSKGPVERISMHTDDPSLWMVPSCPCADVDLTRDLPTRCEDFDPHDDSPRPDLEEDPFSETRTVPQGDFTLVLQKGRQSLHVQVYFAHVDGRVSSRLIEISRFFGSVSWIDVKNVKDERDFAAVMLSVYKKPHYEKLEFPGPIESVQVVSPKGHICVNIVEPSCK